MDRCDSCRYQNDFEFHACHICAMERDMYKPKQTNADRIRSMTDEKLAELISSDFCEIICSPNTNCQYENCRGKILNWLRQEAEHGCAD